MSNQTLLSDLESDRNVTVETPQAQALGGVLNSSMSARTIINLQFLLSVQQLASFRFVINLEAITRGAPSVPSSTSKTSITKTKSPVISFY